jgi:hypothetical protein
VRACSHSAAVTLSIFLQKKKRKLSNTILLLVCILLVSSKIKSLRIYHLLVLLDNCVCKQNLKPYEICQVTAIEMRKFLIKNKHEKRKKTKSKVVFG